MTERAQYSLFVVSGELSGDALAAEIVQALRAELDAPLNLHGVGGPRLAEAGLRSLFPLSDIAVMGFGPVLKRLPTILRRMRQTVSAARGLKPDLLLTVDSPDFSLRVGKRLRKAMPGIPAVHAVCPSVWAWRPGRARKMAPHVDEILCLLPFEPAELSALKGPHGTYIGHPLVEKRLAMRPQTSEDAARRENEASAVVVILPGSRRSEVERLLEIFCQTAALISQAIPGARFVLPAVPHLVKEIQAIVSRHAVPIEIVEGQQAKDAAFRVARAALAASGTVTLELALAKIPMVVAYRVANWEAMLARRLVRVSTMVLPSLVLGEAPFPEFRQEDVTPSILAEAMLAAIRSGAARDSQVKAIERVDMLMQADGLPPSLRAAKTIAGILKSGGEKRAAF